MTNPTHLPATARKRPYTTLWLIVGLLLLPFALATLLYLSGWRPTTTPHGELLPVSSSSGTTVLPAETLAGHWGLALVSHGECESQCVADLDALRRVHVALYKQMPRVRRLWVSDPQGAMRSAEALHARWPDLALIADEGSWQQLQAPQPTSTAVKSDVSLPVSTSVHAVRTVLFIAPDGQAVMRYAAPFDAKAVLKDLSRLLRHGNPA